MARRLLRRSLGKSEAKAAELLTQNWGIKSAVVGNIRVQNNRSAACYFKQLRKLIDFGVIRKARLKVRRGVDVRHGSCYLDTLLEKAGARVTTFHNEVNPSSAATIPEPNAEGMAEVSRFVRSGKASLASDSTGMQTASGS